MHVRDSVDISGCHTHVGSLGFIPTFYSSLYRQNTGRYPRNRGFDTLCLGNSLVVVTRMSNLHAYFALKNEQAFSKLLEAIKSRKQPSTPSSSLGKRSALLTQDIDVNAKDWLGRTVLHIACSTIEPYALTYIRMLLAHPAINVNVQDAESKWTPLHRALYSGNLSACQLLLKRLDIDTHIRDNEGLTSFELYNLTQEGTWPLTPSLYSLHQVSSRDLSLPADFFTWGGNRNATLGHGDSNDRTFPDQVVMPRTAIPPGVDKFTPVQAKIVSMAKLHTAVITDETGHNLRICGFGSGGRLGHIKHTLYNLQHGPQIQHRAISVVAAQDHTLVLTDFGEVWSWGLNRFSQLGYVIESSAMGQLKSEEPIQAVPKRILGPLKKEVVVGISASKIASACWTLDEGDVFTWGTNNGQLGYDSSSQPVQVLPRKVTGVQNVTDIAFTDSAMACLLHTGDVICFHDDNRFRVMFSVSDRLSLTPYIPPSASRAPAMIKVTGCEGTFATLSSKGDVWTFSAPSRLSTPTDGGKEGKTKDRVVVKPQRVWPAKRLVDSARDVALGTNGDLIICTQSGYVFTRSRTTASLSTPKSGSVAVTKGIFYRVPFMHRAIRVYANSAGGFGALRLNYPLRPIAIEGNTLGDNVATMRSWASKEYDLDNKTAQNTIEDNSEWDGDQESTSICRTSAKKLLELLFIDDKSRQETNRGLFSGKMEYGSNMICRAGIDIPVHRALLSARSPVLRTIFAYERHDLRNGSIRIEYTNCVGKSGAVNTYSVLKISGIQPLTVLLLLEFFYTDTIPILDTFSFNKAVQIRREFDQLATVLSINDLFVTGDTNITVRVPTLGQHLWAMFNVCQNDDGSSTNRTIGPDVFIVLLDRQVACHSTILRCRCLFFTYFFEEDAWTTNRWTHDRTITINMEHMEWRGFFYVMKWIYSGEEDALFDNLDDIDTVQNFIDLIFEVISMASELLLDRLMSVCSSILLRFVTISNAPYILSRATHYNVLPLIDSLHDYIACNLEAIMEDRLLDNDREREYDVEDLIPALGRAIRARQAILSPSTRAKLNMDELMKRNVDWLKLQDIPSPIVRSQRIPLDQKSPRLTPTSSGIPPTTPKSNVEDYIFHMDENPTTSPLPSITTQQTAAISASGESPRKVWKSKTMQEIPKVDFKAVMAETAAKTTHIVTTEEKRLSADQPGNQSSARVTAMPPSSSATSLPHISGPPPWNVSMQRPSAVASSISVSAFDSSQARSPAKSHSRVEPGVRVSTGSSSSSPNTIKHSPIIRRRPDVTPWASGSSNKDLSSSPAAGLSFAAIQEQQLAQTLPSMEKPTLRQIQEEERAKKEEEDFMKWWAAEEERVAKQSGTASGTNIVPSNPRKRHGKSRRKGLGQ